MALLVTHKSSEEKTKADYFQELFLIQYKWPYSKVAREIHCNTLNWKYKNCKLHEWYKKPKNSSSFSHLFFKLLALLWSECVCFGNKWNDIHFFMQTLHKLNIQWFKSEIHNI